ncbi:homoprotocatechuate degradation operon regulator HpaR [Parahaliea mediterranea]|uniref:Homoprotocatechuate degradation operon regulator HpaR n=1 Tax=Parahaliea mediterranea TaxID=651086 RepID=A0A939DFN9_9GAMM|nr:homoprotocatechuate degradation operon regulator HpaR [Parahaliea mediterranea]MBN7797314.1 homoprotocatechuate degradation operon regulator HpaR [Parahaliea mediterranea]
MRAFRRSLPMSLLKAREAVMKNFIPHLREHDLSPQQWRVLRALFDAREIGAPEVEMTTLADQCYLLMPSLSRIVQHLAKRGLIQRRTSATDQRRSMISLDETGVELVKVMSVQSEARYAHITQVFGYGKLELLYELLDELTEKLGEEAFEPDDLKEAE